MTNCSWIDSTPRRNELVFSEDPARRVRHERLGTERASRARSSTRQIRQSVVEHLLDVGREQTRLQQECIVSFVRMHGDPHVRGLSSLQESNELGLLLGRK